MPSFNYGGTSLPSTQICGAVPIQNSLYNGTWGNNITGYTCTSIQNIHDSDVQKFYINPERGPITLKHLMTSKELGTQVIPNIQD